MNYFGRMLFHRLTKCNPHPCEGGQNRISGNVGVGTDQVQPPPSDTCWDECTRYYVSFPEL